jgi:hypothetical protein
MKKEKPLDAITTIGSVLTQLDDLPAQIKVETGDLVGKLFKEGNMLRINAITAKFPDLTASLSVLTGHLHVIRDFLSDIYGTPEVEKLRAKTDKRGSGHKRPYQRKDKERLGKVQFLILKSYAKLRENKDVEAIEVSELREYMLTNDQYNSDPSEISKAIKKLAELGAVVKLRTTGKKGNPMQLQMLPKGWELYHKEETV